MKRYIFWILALALVSISSSIQAQKYTTSEFYFEGINLYNTTYAEIVAAFGEPDTYHSSPPAVPGIGPTEKFVYHFPDLNVPLQEGELSIIISDGTMTSLHLRGGQYKIHTDIAEGVGPGDSISWFEQNGFTLGPQREHPWPGVFSRDILPMGDTRGLVIMEKNGVIVALTKTFYF